MATRKDYEHAELLTRSTNLRNDIELVKTHQWQATYYSLLLTAGMFALLKYDSSYQNLALVFVGVVSVVQLVMIAIFQSAFVVSLCKYGKRADVINDLLEEKTRICRTIDRKANVGPTTGRGSSVRYAIGFFIFGLGGPVSAIGYSILKLIAQCTCGRGT